MGIWEELIKQIPAMALMGILVIAFLRHLAVRDKAERKAEIDRQAFLRSLADTCHDAHRELVQGYRDDSARVTEVIGDVNQSMGSVHSALQRINAR